MWVFHWLSKKIFKKTNRGWKEETDKHGFRTVNARSKVGTLKHSCMYLYIARTQRKSHTATKNAESFGHCLHCPVSSFLTARLHILSSEYLTLHFRVPFPTDYFVVSLLSSSFTSGLAGFSGHRSVWSSHQYKQRFSWHSGTTSKMPEMKFSL